MTPNTPSTATTPKKSGWLKKLFIVGAALGVLLVIGFFVVTSGAFFKGVILPRVGKAVKATITVDDASISPFSEVRLRNLKIQTTGPEPLLAVSDVTLRYSLGAILGGNLKIALVQIEAPVITIVEDAEGRRNTDPLMQGASTPAAKPAPSSASKPPQIDLSQFNLKNATVRYIKNHKDGTRDLVEITGMNVILEDVKNGQSGKFAFNAALAAEMNPPEAARRGALKVTYDGKYIFTLAQDLKPTQITGSHRVDVAAATGAFQELVGFGANFAAEVSPTEVKQLVLSLHKAANKLGELRVSGPFDAEKLEGRLGVVLTGIDKRALNLAGSLAGIDFGGTTVGSSNVIEVTSGGKAVSLNGRFDVAKLQLTRTNQSTPVLDLAAEYSLALNTAAQSATLRTLVLTGRQNGQPILNSALAAPMTFAWGTAAGTVGDSTLTVSLTGLNLADWKAFLGDTLKSGTVGAQLKLVSQSAGKLLTFEADSSVGKLSMGAGQGMPEALDLNLSARGAIKEFKQIELSNLTLAVRPEGKSLVAASTLGELRVSGSFDAGKMEGRMGVVMTGIDKRALNLAGSLAGIDFGATTMNSSNMIEVTSGGKAVALNGRFDVAKLQLTRTNQSTPVLDLAAEYSVAVNTAAQSATLRTLALTGMQNGQPILKSALAAPMTFAWGTAAGAVGDSTLTVSLTGLNLADWKAFLGETLKSGTVGASLKLVSQQAGKSLAFEAESSLAKLSDGSGQGMLKALDLDLSVRGAVKEFKQIDLSSLTLAVRPEGKLLVSAAGTASYDLGKSNAQALVSLKLGPTARAANNELTAKLRADLAQPEAITGSVKVTSDLLDVTPLVDLFMADSGKSAPATPPSAAAQPEQEPAAMKLPLRNFTFDADLKRILLRELDLTAVLASAKLDGGLVTVKPLQCNLNGAPVAGSAELDLGVLGWKYDVALKATKVPIAPFADSFVPAYRGVASGDLLADFAIKGAGITGPSLQKNLSGRTLLVLTNASVQMGQPKTAIAKVVKLVVSVLGTALRLPELSAAPVAYFASDSMIGGGQVNLREFNLATASFRMQSRGTVTLAAVSTNSTLDSLPVELSLSRALATQARLANAGTSNGTFVDFGKLASVSGTVGNPKTSPDAVRIGVLTAQGLTGGIKELQNPEAQGLIQGVSSLLGGSGNKGATNASGGAATNAPKNEAVGNVIRGLGGLLGAKNKPAAPATNAPAK